LVAIFAIFQLFLAIWSYKMPKTVAAMDDFDRSILQIVQRNNQLPARDMAKMVGLSESAVLRRLRRMRREKIITADVSIVHPSAIGRSLMVHVLVSLERETSADLDAFTKKLRKSSVVRHAAYVTGEADFVVLLQLSGMDEYEAFTREMFHDDKNVRAFRTLVVIREVAGALGSSLLP
jgi:DNA-binding Lrp family transcriptional regulator